MKTNDLKTFSILITPHRSLSRLGFKLFMSFLVVLSFVAGIIFVKIGAWPVTGFFGVDILIAYWAFKLNYESANRYETLTRDGGDIVLHRYFKNEKIETIRLVKSFTKVEIFHDQEREIIGPLLLRSSNRSYEIASFLGGYERLSLADAIKTELKTISY